MCLAIGGELPCLLYVITNCLRDLFAAVFLLEVKLLGMETGYRELLKKWVSWRTKFAWQVQLVCLGREKRGQPPFYQNKREWQSPFFA